MTNDELITKLKAIVAPYVQNEDAFKNLSKNTDFVNDLKINSANLVDIILDIILLLNQFQLLTLRTIRFSKYLIALFELQTAL